MDNRRNKQTVNDEYNSQPVQKASTWVFQKWRRTTKNASSSASSAHEQPQEEQPQEEQPQEEPDECFSSEKYRRAVHPKLMQISVYFCALLVNIKYFKKTGYPPKLMSLEVNEDYVQTHADMYGNQGVHACMLMEHLVTGKPLNISNNFRESCIAYRRFMADQMYFWRCLPRPG
ncbi:hypothetical protein R6Q59_029493 [Mikania micrantha]